jgi:hypothetical protein
MSMDPRERSWWQKMPLEEFKRRVADMPEHILIDLRSELKEATSRIEMDLNAAQDPDPQWRARAKWAQGAISQKSKHIGFLLAKISVGAPGVRRARWELEEKRLQEAAEFIGSGNVQGALCRIVEILRQRHDERKGRP